MFYAIILDSNNNGTGAHAYAEEPASYPANEFPCTQAQSQNPSLWQVTNGALVESLTAAQNVQNTTLSKSCASQITSGFSSWALGAAYTYPYQDHDQRNLSAAATASLAPTLPTTWTASLWCADSTGAWAIRKHTAAQVQQVMADSVAAREAASSKLSSLSTQVLAATTVVTVQAIVW